MPSETGHRMRRSKSAPSVRKHRPAVSVPEALDPEIARHHATTAASLAMTQAKDRTSHTSQEERKSYSRDAAPTPVTANATTATVRHHSPSIRFVGEGGLTNHNNTIVSHTLTSSTQHDTDATNEQDPPTDAYTIREFQGFGNEELFAPSSYRRLRKARSMFSTRSMRSPRAGAVSSNGVSHTEPSLRKKSAETAPDKHKSLRHSLSFFNGASNTIRRAKSHYAIPTRPQFTEEPVKEAMPRLPSLHRKETRLAQKSLRPTVRTMRELSPDDDAIPVSNGTGLHKKARALSLHIKKRLKRVFGLPGSAEDEFSDERSIESPYGDSILFDSNSPSTIYEASPSVLHSKQSFESIATSASRVTSWTNSTAGNTVKTKHMPGRNHLSTIEEGVDAVSGSQFGVPENGTEHVKYQQGKQIDSQRMYSALMRHIGETASKDGERVLSSGTVIGYPVITERSSSVQPQHEGRVIRQKASDMSMKTAQTSFPVNSRPGSSQSHSSCHSQYLDTSRPITSAKAKQHDKPLSKNPSKISLREPESPFFPSPGLLKPKTPSPYRVAMNSIRENEDSDNDTASVIIRETADTGRVSTSPSVYSRTPSGCTVSRENLCHEIDDPMQSGMATIFDSQVPYKSSKKRGSPATGVKSKHSAEWKNWVDSQMNNIDIFDVPKLASPPIVREHHREDAECDGESMQMVPAVGEQFAGHNEKFKPKNYLTEVGKLYTSREFRQTTPVAERKLSGQSNFSRPLSRQSVGSLRLAGRPSVDGDMMRHYGIPDNVKVSHRQGIRDAPEEPFLSTKSRRSADIANSPNRRLAIKTAREARLNRSPGGLSTVQQIDDQKDARAVQFRSIRGGQDYAIRNKENERSPSLSRKGKAVAGLADLAELDSTIDSKRMVDMFLDSRRVREDDARSGSVTPAFI